MQPARPVLPSVSLKLPGTSLHRRPLSSRSPTPLSKPSRLAPSLWPGGLRWKGYPRKEPYPCKASGVTWIAASTSGNQRLTPRPTSGAPASVTTRRRCPRRNTPCYQGVSIPFLLAFNPLRPRPPTLKTYVAARLWPGLHPSAGRHHHIHRQVQAPRRWSQAQSGHHHRPRPLLPGLTV